MAAPFRVHSFFFVSILSSIPLNNKYFIAYFIADTAEIYEALAMLTDPIVGRRTVF